MTAFEAARLAAALPQRFCFPVPLISGVILSRPNRFVMNVELAGQEVSEGSGSQSRPRKCPCFQTVARLTKLAQQGTSHRCHVPVTGKVAGLQYREMQNLRLPCLLSRPLQVGTRKTKFTVEALALEPEGKVTTWYGVNQAASTRYIGHFLTAGAMPEIVLNPALLAAERKV